MNKKQDDGVLEAKLGDAVRLAQSRPRFVGFLDERQAVLVQNLMEHIPFKNYMLWGGYDGSERVVFGAFPDFQQPDASAFPVVPITALYRSADTLSHRDFLGALLANGIVRETIGDILVEEGRSIIFAREEISEFVLSQTVKIGRAGVKLSRGAAEPLPQRSSFADFSAVVASARLDCMVSAALGTSREKASEMIRTGLVMLNHEINTSVSILVTQGGKFSVRGKGRFIVDRIGPQTKKGRLSIAGRKYI